MKPIQLLPVWAFLALVLTGCNTMSRTQCAKGTRVILVSNFLIDVLSKEDSTVVVKWNDNKRQLRRDESFEIVQLADENRMIPAVELTIHWRGMVKKVTYPAVVLDPHFFGPQEPVDLFLSPNLNNIVLAAF